MGIDHRLNMAKLYLCTDAREKQGDLPDFLRAVFAGGVDLVQIRQKNMKPEDELAALGVARDVAFGHQGLVVVNDNPQLAHEFASDVLHLGQDDEAPAKARPLLHQWAKIGRSTHSTEQADAAIADPEVDYFCVGPVWQTPTKPDYTPVGLDLVKYAVDKAQPMEPGIKPWFAIGGIDHSTIDQVLEVGARRVCVVRAIYDADDPQEAASKLSEKLRQAWREDPRAEKYAFQASRSSVSGQAKLK